MDTLESSFRVRPMEAAQPLRVYFQTFGCQMNEHDSEKMAELLCAAGYTIVEKAESADVLLLNTCSVRENPENKVYSFLGRIREWKAEQPNRLIGVGGCVAQQEKEKIFRLAPAVDLVFGPDQAFNIVNLLGQARTKRTLSTDWLHTKTTNFISSPAYVDSGPGLVRHKSTASIAITKGCDNFCSFCIVPFTRGRLFSRALPEILAEATSHLARGIKEILLLGQNVNSYSWEKADFFGLLVALSELKGLKRLRFISPHPKDWDNRLSDLMASQANLCPYLHLPFQSGSSRILALMRRDHDIEKYKAKLAYLKKVCPSVALSTDVIVGFPTETESEFQETLAVLKELEFINVYGFKYSPRPGTKAEKLPDDVSKEIKERRLADLLDLQAQIAPKLLQAYVGKRVEILLEDEPKPGFFTGRSPQNIRVWVAGQNLQLQEFYHIGIESIGRTSLNGSLAA